MRALLLGPALIFAAAACDYGDCTTQPAAMQLSILARADLPARSLSIEVNMPGYEGSKTFDLDGQLADGSTSLEVILDGAPKESFEIHVRIAAYAEPGGQGEMLALGGDDSIAEPNACNRFEVELGPPRPIDPPDAGVEAGGGDAGIADPSPDADAAIEALPDAEPPPPIHPDADLPDALDAGVEADGGDAEPVRCPAPDPATLALYNFDNDVNTSTLTDATGAHPGTVTGGTPDYDDGPDGCGRAISFPAGANVQQFGHIDDSQDWDLAEGSVDLWLYLSDRPPRNQRLGVLARDSNGNGRGRFSMRTACDGTVVAKLEATSSVNNRTSTYFQCSDAPLARDTWAHITVNFGPPGFELLIDGVVQTRTGAVSLLGFDCLQTVTCGTSTTAGIAGNSFPWIIGADANEVYNNNFSAMSLEAPLDDGAIDHLRISNVRRP